MQMSKVNCEKGYWECSVDKTVCDQYLFYETQEIVSLSKLLKYIFKNWLTARQREILCLATSIGKSEGIFAL